MTQESRGGEPQETAAPHPAHRLEDISGVDNWVEEGGPLEPQDLEPDGGFGDAAAEMANEPFDTVAAQPAQEPTEVEEDPVERQLAERTADLQRLQAEYVNYKRRVDRDRDLVRQNATYGVLSSLLPVLDDIDRAREHGEVEGGFKAVADSLERVVSGLGLTKFGAPGEPFDPNVHEALAHGHSPDVTETVVEHLAQAGYRIGDRVVRAAKVTVLDPEG
ncbi:MAG TPA: nucleotide exchange factor GrpE [Marmoricola sp.]|nr:nucleotide exchange factor GrpE [Marmoricola sp.]